MSIYTAKGGKDSISSVWAQGQLSITVTFDSLLGTINGYWSSDKIRAGINTTLFCILNGFTPSFGLFTFK